MTAQQVADWGLGLDDITAVLKAHAGVHAEALHTDPSIVSLNQFRQSIVDAMAEPDTYLIANFDRYEFMGEGGGHHCPLGAFCAEADAVLVLDVARYRSGPRQAHRCILFWNSCALLQGRVCSCWTWCSLHAVNCDCLLPTL